MICYTMPVEKPVEKPLEKEPLQTAFAQSATCSGVAFAPRDPRILAYLSLPLIARLPLARQYDQKSYSLLNAKECTSAEGRL